MIEQSAQRRFLNSWRLGGWGLAAVMLSLPAIAMRFTKEVAWTASDFVIMGIMIGVVGLGLELAIRASCNHHYRAGAAVALLTGFLVIWSNLAVGIIGDEDNPANLIFFGIIVIVAVASSVSRLIPGGVTRVMAVTAAAQFGVPLIAMVIWSLPITPDLVRTIVFNSIFSGMWLLSAWLFRRDCDAS